MLNMAGNQYPILLNDSLPGYQPVGTVDVEAKDATRPRSIKSFGLQVCRPASGCAQLLLPCSMQALAANDAYIMDEAMLHISI